MANPCGSTHVDTSDITTIGSVCVCVCVCLCVCVCVCLHWREGDDVYHLSFLFLIGLSALEALLRTEGSAPPPDGNTLTHSSFSSFSSSSSSSSFFFSPLPSCSTLPPLCVSSCS